MFFASVYLTGIIFSGDALTFKRCLFHRSCFFSYEPNNPKDPSNQVKHFGKYSHQNVIFFKSHRTVNSLPETLEITLKVLLVKLYCVLLLQLALTCSKSIMETPKSIDVFLLTLL